MLKCKTENDQLRESINSINNTFLTFSEKDERFNLVSNTLKELENVDISVLQPIYEYKINEREEEANEARSIVKEFKLNYLDPSKYVVKLNKSNAWKNATKMKKAFSQKIK